MIYLVTKNQFLFTDPEFTVISVEKSLEILNSWDRLQTDSETSGRNPHLTDFLCVQFGNKKAGHQIVIDCTTIDIIIYKDIIESKLLILQNGKFDIQYFYKHKIIPTHIWDTMIIEQLLTLGYNRSFYHYGLADILQRRFNIYMDKSVRGEIIWRGLDKKVIKYAATDVVYLEDIMEAQMQECVEKNCMVAASIENNFVPVIAYLEWCGIKLDAEKWKVKMKMNEENLSKALIDLNNWVVEQSKTDSFFKPYISVNTQGDLFSGFDLTPVCSINWSSAKQVIPIFNHLGFRTEVEDKKTGELKDSVVEKVLATQKGINDEFLNTYFAYKGADKECSTYGQNYLNAINPITGRIHTTFWQLGAASGRMSCGSSNSDSDLAKYKHLPESECKYVQLQNLPADEITRESFISEEGNLFTSADYSALESRLGADIYQEQAMLHEFLHGSGDMHSLCAYMVFKDDIPRDTNISKISTLYPKLRKKVKPIEFSQQFGGGAKAVASALGCSMKEASEFVKAYSEGFKGIAAFKARGSQFVRNNGYIVMNQHTGIKLYWEDFTKWRRIEDMPDWERNQTYTKQQLDEHASAAAKWDRLALNSVTQGTGAEIIKLAGIIYFNWIIKNNLFEKVLLCDIVHDEICTEYPESIKEVVESALTTSMEKAAAQLCHSLPIPAEAATGKFWIH